ncbi:hypothetical protein L7E55_02875 [Pelotomaculum isophthalicicum JI]|uniref:Spore coat protein U domain-containing protein n=1 Tax=Pelotomaculum isophthalicicum JI TaxID=947010 RepID=A0A9X4H719_9FIRM|nr:hypothetical protein [Pelotomaculum isophthalicicum]MDF9407309.1 hypothetical protein [Pelotomaculum isophthalicicum JI]
MKKTVAILLMLGILMVAAGIVNAATLAITANVQNSLTLALNPASLTFNNVQQGTATTPETLTATTSGTGAYQLQLSSTSFIASGGVTQPASVLQYRDQLLAGNYANASGTATNMLASAGTAVVGGDAKNFDIRVNFPGNASDGSYTATVTISAVPQ